MKSDANYNLKSQLLSNFKNLNLYQQSVLLPDRKIPARVPGTFSRETVLFKRFTTQTYSTNASGHFCVYSFPSEVFDSSGLRSSYFVNTATSAYDPSTASVNVNAIVVDTRPFYNITTGTMKSSRVVSFCLKITSLSTALNRKGTMYGALYRTASVPSAVYTGAGACVLPTIPTIQNSNPIIARVGDGQGIKINYVPADDDDFQFMSPNTANDGRHPGADDVFALVVLGQGLEVNSQIKVEVNVNFEVVPAAESSLAGIEEMGYQPFSIPSQDIQHLLRYHYADLVKTIDGYEGYSQNLSDAMNISRPFIKKLATRIPKTGPTNNKPKYTAQQVKKDLDNKIDTAIAEKLVELQNYDVPTFKAYMNHTAPYSAFALAGGINPGKRNLKMRNKIKKRLRAKKLK
jgi:hypothetical protein